MSKCPECGRPYEDGERFCPVDGTRLPRTVSQALDPLIGKLLDGRYRVEKLLGGGGVGRVYRATHEGVGRMVALKVLRDSAAASESTVERFKREARSAASIGDRRIVDVYDFGQLSDGSHFLVMEYLDGEDLASRLEREGPLDEAEGVRILLQTARGLAAAHRKDILHRDLKPENVFLVDNPEGKTAIKLVDFGLAKMADVQRQGSKGMTLTKTGMVFGTPRYLTPEQCRGYEMDKRSDVYGLGLIGYSIFAGDAPFDGDNFMAVLHKHVNEIPPPFAQKHPSSQVTPEVEAVIMRALSKEPDDRPQSMDEFAEELAAAARGGVEPTGAFRRAALARDASDAYANRARRSGNAASNPPPPSGSKPLSLVPSDPAERSSFAMGPTVPESAAPSAAAIEAARQSLRGNERQSLRGNERQSGSQARPIRGNNTRGAAPSRPGFGDSTVPDTEPPPFSEDPIPPPPGLDMPTETPPPAPPSAAMRGLAIGVGIGLAIVGAALGYIAFG